MKASSQEKKRNIYLQGHGLMIKCKLNRLWKAKNKNKK
jgi:hypothetical protein